VLQRFMRQSIEKNRAFHRVIVVRVPLRNCKKVTILVRVNHGIWHRVKHLQFECLRTHFKKSGMYIRSTVNGTYLHRLAMEHIKGGPSIWEGGKYTCEHKDHDPTNNQISNLTLFTKDQQAASKRGHSDSKLGDVKGVSLTKSGSYLVECKLGPCRIRKTVKSIHVAKMLYNHLTRALNGKFAHVNRVDDATEEETSEANDLADGLLSNDVPYKRAKHVM
jgi:hypothetical protein